MAGALKKSTGLTGLAVSKNPHYVLGLLYKKILGVLDKMPETSVYRQSTESVIKERLDVVNSEPDIAKMEKKINGGMAEELILQAENEILLARRMLVWRPWEKLMKEPPANQWKWPV